MSHAEEHEFEYMRGLPAALPDGEHILWQGEPNWKAIATRVLHVRAVAAYFAGLFAWRVGDHVERGLGWASGFDAAAILIFPGVFVTLLLMFLGWGLAKTTVYTITNRRVVFRCGIALAKAVNVPFQAIDSAAMKSHRDGRTDLALTIGGKDRPAYLLLWPHVRPFRINRCQPMLRGLDDGQAVARILAKALADYHGRPAEVTAAKAAAGTEGPRAAARASGGLAAAS